MNNKFSDMRQILICYALAAEESESYHDGLGSDLVPRFSAKVQTLPGISVSRKIQALAYLLDNQLETISKLLNILDPDIENTKEEAFAALQMAITAMSVNYQNGNNE